MTLKASDFRHALGDLRSQGEQVLRHDRKRRVIAEGGADPAPRTRPIIARLLLACPYNALGLTLGLAQRERPCISLPEAAVWADHDVGIVALAEAVLIPFGVETCGVKLRLQFVLTKGSVMEASALHARCWPPIVTTLDAN